MNASASGTNLVSTAYGTNLDPSADPTSNAAAPAAAVHFSPALGSGEAEELQRAELYGLLARLWLQAPDDALMAEYE